MSGYIIGGILGLLGLAVVVAGFWKMTGNVDVELEHLSPEDLKDR